MAYHIKRPSSLKAGTTVYHVGGRKWTEVYADRKVYNDDPTALLANEDGTNGGFSNATVVDE